MAKKSLEGLTESMYYILMAFLREDRCGKDVIEFVSKKTKDRVKIGPGTLYTILAKYEEEGVIRETAVEGRKRTYVITEKGLQLFKEEFKRLQSCVQDGEGDESV